MQPNPFELDYQERAERWQHDADLLEAQRQRLSNLRLIAGAAMIAAGIYWIVTRQLAALPAALIALVVLALLVRRYHHLTKLWSRATTLATINRHGVARVQRNWTDLPEPRSFAIPDRHPYARDLDLLGRASLQQLIDTTGTTMGSHRLAGWLMEPAPATEIDLRQEAVRELSGDLEWLQELQQSALRGEIDEENTADFVEWATQGPGRFPIYAWLARASLLAIVVIVVLAVTQTIDANWIGVLFIFNLLLTRVLHHRVGESLDAAIAHGNAIRSYTDLLELLGTRTHSAALLQQIDRPLHVDGVTASEAAGQLSRLLGFGIPRGSLQSYVMQAVVAWDAHLYDRLAVWRMRYGAHVPDWLDAIGSYEALGALANLAHDNPAWAYPAVNTTTDRMIAEQLGHPLIPENRRVCNDVTLGPAGTFLFVTGSNMSGKSTLLRAIGLDIVLANTGAPVCAQSLAIPPFSLWTSVRIVDSLEAGISYYMAELLRLKQIVDAALAPRDDDRIICFLLDEILSGTNTGERQIAARRIIDVLTDHGALGAVSSHDLDLVAEGELAGKAVNVHLAENVTRTGGVLDMTFDYRLRPGLATSTNALKLMELVGIPLQDTVIADKKTDSRRTIE